MKITPLEIRQKSFEKAFRGLDKDEVEAFLTILATEWEKLMDENKELKIKLESSEKEVEKLREVENSLFKTLKTAEDTGANMIDQATKTAQLHMRETEMKAEALMNEAKTKAKDMIEEAEMKSRNAIDDMEDRVKSLANVYRQLENVKEDLLSDIKSFANEAIDKANRVKSQVKKVNIDEELMKVKRDIAPAKASKKVEVELELDTPAEPEPKKEEPKNDVEVEKVSYSGKSTSFFDDID
ncbi:DivIVA domain-containing protein [Fulvivirga sp.]|uniref:DivIVA domain-containing protein n=1 Tax=Fulvivirga sp. TaxID=1931237 RepID=UPI0032EF80C6